MKRLFNILVSLALLITMLPTKISVVFADTTYPVVYVGGVALNDGKYLESGSDVVSDSQPSDNYAHYSNGILSLYNYSYTGTGYKANKFNYYAGIYTNGELTVNLVGINNISISGSGLSIGIYTTDDLTISGDGKITLNADDYGMLSDNNVIFESGEVVAVSKYAIYAVNNVRVLSASIDATSNATTDDQEHRAIYCIDGSLELSSNVTITASDDPNVTPGEYDPSKLSDYDRIIIKTASDELSFSDSSSYDIGVNRVNMPILPFSVALTVSGGEAPYVFSKASGPEWITVSSDGNVSGTPTTVGSNALLVVRVTDNAGQSKDISIDVGDTDPDTYVVSFDANGGTSSMANVNAFGEYTLPENGFTAPDGKRFKCWNVNGVEKSAGDTITVLADVSIKAVWEDAPIPEIWVGGVGMFDGDYLANDATSTTRTQPISTGYAHYNEGILTLYGYSYTGKGYYNESEYNYAAIYSTIDIAIVCVEETFSSLVAQGDDSCNGIVSTSDVLIRGNGSLTVKAEDCAIFIDGDLTVNGIGLTVINVWSNQANSISITTGKGVEVASTKGIGFMAQDDVNIYASKLKITAFDHAIHTSGNVNLSGEILELDSTNGSCIYALSGDTVVNNKNVTISGYASISCDELTINSSNVELNATLSYNHAILAYNNVSIIAENITINSNGNGIFSYGDIVVNCDNIEIDCVYGTALYALDRLVNVEAEYIDLSAQTCIMANEVLVTATNDIDLCATSSYGIYSESDVRITTKNINIESHDTALYSDDGRLIINATENVSLISNGGKQAVYGYLTVTAKEFIMAGVTLHKWFEYTFNNQFDKEYVVFEGDAVDNLTQTHVISSNSSYIDRIDTNVVKITELVHILSDWKHNDTHHWRDCSCGLTHEMDTHRGGTATCNDRAICVYCSEPYGDLDDHDYGELIPAVDEKHTPAELSPSVAAHYHCSECGKYFTESKVETTLAELTGETPSHNFDQKHNSTHHWDECSCGLTQNESIHTGGTATCKEKAVCQTCFEPYGNLADHDYGELIPTVDEKHTPAELSPSVAAHYHCSECGKYFTESKTETTLAELTGETPTHSFDQKHNSTHHWDECSCGLKQNESIHTGGTATCKDRAICETCLEPYGNLADHDYGELIPAVDEKHTPTELKPSVAAHYHCAECGKYFTADKAETTLAELTGETPTHSFDQKHNSTHHWDECSCGLKQNESIHTGGMATCKDRAICQTCFEPYGNLADHDYGELIPESAEKHTPAELSPSVAAHYHCAECGKYFTEGKAETTLDALSGETPTHSFDHKHNATHHWDECSCGLKQNESIHTGGTATCKEKAVCQTCSTPYGDLADHDYGELIPAVDEKHTPTELKPSVAAHYHCVECGKYFTAGKTETTLDALTGETPTHSFDQKHNSTHHWDECSCGLKQNETLHTGGTATCKEKAVCQTCFEPYGDLADHDYGELIPAVDEKHTPAELSPSVAAHYHCAECGKYFTESKTETTLDALTGETPTHSFDQKHNSTHHWDECSCGLKQNENLHTGGTATCKDRAICQTCSTSYGELADHDYGDLIPESAEKHTPAELSPSIAAHYHCAECGKYFTESKTETTLAELTGETPSHDFDQKHNSTHHWDECSCGLKQNESIHTGGTATCKDRAICQTCFAPYGGLADHDYGELIPAVDEKHTPTELKPSVAAHYHCAECGKYFTESKTETTLDALSGEMPSHSFDQKHNSTHHWDECSCGLKQNESIHTGGTATCKDRAICQTCSEPYGDLADHDYGELIPAVDEKHTPTELKPSVATHYHCAECGKYFTESKTETTLDALTGETPSHDFDQKHNSTHHWDECSCGLKQNENLHTGGTATCKERAICQTCSEPYGDLSDHDYGELIPASAEKHTPTELKPSVAAHYHCSECGKYFTESKVETTLAELTGETPTHSFDQKHNSTHHWDECSCGLKQNENLHTGGTPTCNDRAICQTCSTPYGDLSDHDYGELIPASAEKHTPTELKPSVAAHYHCEICDNFFTDDKKLTSLKELTGKTPTHIFNDWQNDEHKHWKECSCGLVIEAGEHVDTDTDGSCDSCNYQIVAKEPDLGDNGILYYVLLIISIIGIAATLLHGKRKLIN